MAAPLLYGSASNVSAFGASRVVPMPLTPGGDPPEPGMALIALVSGESQVGTDTAAGGSGQTWTGHTVANNGGGEYLRVWKATALGGGADALTVNGGFANRIAGSMAFANWDGVLANILYLAATTNTINPPSLNMGAARDHAIIAVARNNNNPITGPPANYTMATGFPVGTGNVKLAAAVRYIINTQTEDPGAFGGTLSAGVAATLGIRPGTSGPPPSPRGAGFLHYYLSHHPDELATRREHRDRWARRDSGIYCREDAA